MHDRISVAVATRNRPQDLARCIAAIISGDALPAEIVVVDQSDDEATRDLLMTHGQEPVPFVYVRQEARGLSKSRNTAINRSTGSIIAFTDDDCVPDPGWIAAVTRAFSTSAVAALTGRVLPLGPEQPGLVEVSSRTSRVRIDFRGRALPWRVGTGGNTAVRREWLERIGRFDERLGAGAPGKSAEDMDLLYRLAAAGALVRFEPDAIMYHARQPAERRLASRHTYGYGFGAFCAITARRRDPYVSWMLLRWCIDRAWVLAKSLVRLRWRRAKEEILMLSGCAVGFWTGLRGGLGRAKDLRRPQA